MTTGHQNQKDSDTSLMIRVWSYDNGISEPKDTESSLMVRTQADED